jgi:Cu+-exporting ATPase
MVGIGRGAKMGILVRDIDALQNAERIDTVVLDKTGTVTQGKPAVVGAVSFNGQASGDDVLRLAAAAEQFSEHPLAKAIVAHARSRGVRFPDPSSFTNDPGHGVVATVDGDTLLVGSESLLRKHDVPAPQDHKPRAQRGTSGAPDPSGAARVEAEESWSPLRSEPGLSNPTPEEPDPAQTQVYVARQQREGNRELLGLVSLSDQVKPDSAAAVRELHALGLKTVLLTGDNESTAQHIAGVVGITDVRANVKPGGKADVVRALQDRLAARAAVERETDDAVGSPPGTTIVSRRRARTAGGVAMVGDGVNDAPALAAADLGIAIGSGSDVAKETGGIVLVSGSLRGVATSIRLSRATMRTIRQNLFFAFAYNVLAIPLAAFGLLDPLVAAAAMALSDVTVIGNALLLRRAKV